MRSSSFLSVSALCVAVLAGCGGGSDPESALAGTDTVAAADLKARHSKTSDGDSSDSSTGSVTGSATGSTTGSTTSSGTTSTGAATGVPTGRLLASNCFNCHGTDGHPSGGFDSLAGDSASEIVKTLKEMAAKSPEDGGIMRAHAMGYTEAQMWQLGSYFASRR